MEFAHFLVDPGADPAAQDKREDDAAHTVNITQSIHAFTK